MEGTPSGAHLISWENGVQHAEKSSAVPPESLEQYGTSRVHCLELLAPGQLGDAWIYHHREVTNGGGNGDRPCPPVLVTLDKRVGLIFETETAVPMPYTQQR